MELSTISLLFTTSFNYKKKLKPNVIYILKPNWGDDAFWHSSNGIKIKSNVRIDVWSVVPDACTFPSHPFFPQVPAWIIHSPHGLIITIFTVLVIIRLFWIRLPQFLHHKLHESNKNNPSDVYSFFFFNLIIRCCVFHVRVKSAGNPTFRMVCIFRWLWSLWTRPHRAPCSLYQRLLESCVGMESIHKKSISDEAYTNSSHIKTFRQKELPIDTHA